MATKAPPIPKVVPIPSGYRRATQKEITAPVLAFARAALEHALPIGKNQVTVVTNVDPKSKAESQQMVLALTEWHYDNHPSGGKGPPYWHPGISMFVPIDSSLHKPAAIALKKISPFPTEARGLPQSHNEFAGDAEERMTAEVMGEEPDLANLEAVTQEVLDESAGG
jgi:hypothetical protein